MSEEGLEVGRRGSHPTCQGLVLGETPAQTVLCWPKARGPFGCSLQTKVVSCQHSG